MCTLSDSLRVCPTPEGFKNYCPGHAATRTRERDAEGAPFETAVLVGSVDRCLTPPDNERRGSAARRATRHEPARGQEPHRPARDPPGGDRNGDGRDRPGPREPGAEDTSELRARAWGRQSVSAPLDRHISDVVHARRGSIHSRPMQPRAPPRILRKMNAPLDLGSWASLRRPMRS
jgi:hypothetical protein